MTTRCRFNTDHWSKMRMNVSQLEYDIAFVLLSLYFTNIKIIKDSINNQQRGYVISWQKHKKLDVQDELQRLIRSSSSSSRNKFQRVYNFEDIVTVELNQYVPGTAYFRRRADCNFNALNEHRKKTIKCKSTLLSGF